MLVSREGEWGLQIRKYSCLTTLISPWFSVVA